MAEEKGQPIIIGEYELEKSRLRKQGIILLNDEICICSAKDICEDIQLAIIEKVNPIRLFITSPGGEVAAGISIIDSIEYAKSKGITVNGEVFGSAMSMACIILEYCDRRTISPNGWLMNHGVTEFSVGDIKDTKARLTFLRGLQNQFAQQFAAKNTSKDKKYHTEVYWRNQFEENTPQFINAISALDMGLVDEIRSK